MTEPSPYRIVLGMRVPLAMVPRVVAAIRARYPEVTAGITDPDAIFRAATRAWVIESLTSYEEGAARQPLDTAIARTVTEYEEKARVAKERALTDAAQITEDVPAPPGDPQVP